MKKAFMILLLLLILIVQLCSPINNNKHFLLSLKEPNSNSNSNYGSDLDPSDLIKHYNIIFENVGYNRNAAGHVWSSYILDKSALFTENEIYTLFSQFCPVSGSPITLSNNIKPYPYTINHDGTMVSSIVPTGFAVYHCCWPCVCDLEDCGLVKKMSYPTKSNNGTIVNTEFNMIVMKQNPCKNKNNTVLDPSAPATLCKDNKLYNSITIDGLPIIGIVQKTNDVVDMKDIKSKCYNRKITGYKSGMGKIFRNVCNL